MCLSCIVQYLWKFELSLFVCLFAFYILRFLNIVVNCSIHCARPMCLHLLMYHPFITFDPSILPLTFITFNSCVWHNVLKSHTTRWQLYLVVCLKMLHCYNIPKLNFYLLICYTLHFCEKPSTLKVRIMNFCLPCGTWTVYRCSSTSSSSSNTSWASKLVDGLENYRRSLKWVPIPLSVGFAYICYQQYGHIKKREQRKTLGISKPEDYLASQWQVGQYETV